MKKIARHLQKRKRIYLEIVLALVVILGFGLLYQHEETNFETYLAAKGATSYYFNILTEDQATIDVMEHWGAERISRGNEIRFKQML